MEAVFNKLRNRVLPDVLGLSGTAFTLELATTESTEVGNERTWDAQAESWVGAGVPQGPATATLNGVMSGFKKRDVDGTVVQVGDMRLLLEVGDLSEADVERIKTVSRVQRVGETTWWNVVDVESVSPSGITIALKLQLRK